VKLTDIQEKWLQALESGEYKQCRMELHDDNGGHCCLGVASLVLGNEERVGSTLNDDEVKELGLRSDCGAISEGSWQVTDDGIEEKGGGFQSLTGLNDSGATFEQIAAFIREDPSRVFEMGMGETG